jgi:hypothetical protein
MAGRPRQGGRENRGAVGEAELRQLDLSDARAPQHEGAVALEVVKFFDLSSRRRVSPTARPSQAARGQRRRRRSSLLASKLPASRVDRPPHGHEARPQRPDRKSTPAIKTQARNVLAGYRALLAMTSPH